MLSVHFVDGSSTSPDDCLRDDERWRDVDVIFRRYYELLAEAASARAPEPAIVLAHPDVRKQVRARALPRQPDEERETPR